MEKVDCFQYGKSTVIYVVFVLSKIVGPNKQGKCIAAE